MHRHSNFYFSFPNACKIFQLASIAILSLPSFSHASHEIHWTGPCFNDAPQSICGTLDVPLDYTDQSSNQTIPLHVIKLPAAVPPAEGSPPKSVIANWGGPGEDNFYALAHDGGQQIQAYGHLSIVIHIY